MPLATLKTWMKSTNRSKSSSCPKTRHPSSATWPQAFKLQYYKGKVDECISASEVCKSVVVLQAIRWTAMAWDNVSETTVVKCFIKAGILDSKGNTNTVEFSNSNSDVDPFAELESELVAVEDLANETSDDNTVSLRQVVDGCFNAPVCEKAPRHWENFFPASRTWTAAYWFNHCKRRKS